MLHKPLKIPSHLSEKIIPLLKVDPREIYGTNNRYLNAIKNHFPGLKITARGEKLKVNGSDPEIQQFEEKMDEIVAYFNRYNSLNLQDLERILKSEKRPEEVGPQAEQDLILHGVNGQAIRARGVNQRRMVQAVSERDMLFAIGPAGTGKTYTAVALAVRALKNREIKRIVLTRPAVEAGENLGFLPGDLKEKLDPYLQPLYDALREMIPPEKLAYYLESGVIQIAPLAFMRGRTLDRAFVILDEAQNTTRAQMKMFLTRMGAQAKFIVTGDISQIDLPRRQQSGLQEALRILHKMDDIAVVQLSEDEVMRHRLVRQIIRAYDQEEVKQQDESTRRN